MRLIDADALKESIHSSDTDEKKVLSTKQLHEALVEWIDSRATIDAAEGEWKHTITCDPYCSNCEYVFGEDEEFSPFWSYCPMCGARIKGGDTE